MRKNFDVSIGTWPTIGDNAAAGDWGGIQDIVKTTLDPRLKETTRTSSAQQSATSAAKRRK